MKVKLIGIFVCMLLVGTVLPVTGTVTNNNKKTLSTKNSNILYVGGSGEGNYTRIQDAIDDSVDGDTVFVYDDSSPYYEILVVIKTINLIGEDKSTTIIDGNYESDVILVSANDVYIQDFTIRRSAEVAAGIKVTTDSVHIDNNIIIDNYHGVKFDSWYKSINDCIVSNNIIKSNNAYGIVAWASSQHPFTGLTYTGNEIKNNGNSGIWCADCPYSIITNNIINNNQDGINMQWHSNNSLISNNIIINNDFFGFWLVYTGNCTITNNYIANSGFEGLCLYDWEGDIVEGCNNTIYHNNILDNAWDEYGYNYWDNGYPSGGNFYEDYTEEDNYRGPNQDIPGWDGIGDTLYIIPGDDSGSVDYYPLMYEWGEQPPVADFIYTIDDLSVLFDASSSYDRDGTVVSYDWDFGDGESGTGLIVEHTYSEIGEYSIELTVTDNDNKEGNWSQIIACGYTPYIPSNPNPLDDSIDVDVNADLSWNCFNPDEDPLTFDVYFEADDPSPDVLVSENQEEMTYDPGKMNYSTQYYWQIVSWNIYGESTSGPIWSFTTEANVPPDSPSNPYPSDGAINVDINAILSWECSDPDGDELFYNVFFEADDPTPDELVSLGQVENWYDPGTMEWDTTYYWQIIAYDEYGGTTFGPIWCFITIEEPENLPPELSDEFPVDEAINVPVTISELSIFISDPEGDSFSWTIETCPNIGSSSGLNEYDGKKICSVSDLQSYTTYIWFVNATDSESGYSSEKSFTFTTEELPESDLNCYGKLRWSNIKVGTTVIGSFTVENIGDPGSELNWYIDLDSIPEWGIWTISPMDGSGLTPEDGPIKVEVSVVAPSEKDKEFSGNIKVVNLEDPLDFDVVSVYLSTPRNRVSIVSYWLSLLEGFPILHRLLSIINMWRR